MAIRWPRPAVIPDEAENGSERQRPERSAAPITRDVARGYRELVAQRIVRARRRDSSRRRFAVFVFRLRPRGRLRERSLRYAIQLVRALLVFARAGNVAHRPFRG